VGLWIFVVGWLGPRVSGVRPCSCSFVKTNQDPWLILEGLLSELREALALPRVINGLINIYEDGECDRAISPSCGCAVFVSSRIMV